MFIFASLNNDYDAKIGNARVGCNSAKHCVHELVHDVHELVHELVHNESASNTNVQKKGEAHHCDSPYKNSLRSNMRKIYI